MISLHLFFSSTACYESLVLASATSSGVSSYVLATQPSQAGAIWV